MADPAMLTATLARLLARAGETLLGFLAARGVAPNAVTVAGTAVHLAAAALFALGRLLPAGLLVLAGGLLDLLDGALARRLGRMTPFGAFLDSTLDRCSDGALLVGILVHFARTGRPGLTAVAGAALVGAFVTSYARARAESLTAERVDVGLWERPERIGAIVTGGVLDLLPGATALLALLGNLTALQRILWVRRLLAEPGGAAPRPLPLLLRLQVRRFGLLYDLILLLALALLLAVPL